MVSTNKFLTSLLLLITFCFDKLEELKTRLILRPESPPQTSGESQPPIDASLSEVCVPD
jgi:hypothetical protein